MKYLQGVSESKASYAREIRGSAEEKEDERHTLVRNRFFGGWENHQQQLHRETERAGGEYTHRHKRVREHTHARERERERLQIQREREREREDTHRRKHYEEERYGP